LRQRKLSQITGKRSPKLSRGLKTSASAATERRKASAPASGCPR
jgi:hypothetical protein